MSHSVGAFRLLFGLLLALAVLVNARPASAQQALEGPFHFQWGDAAAKSKDVSSWPSKARLRDLPNQGGRVLWIAVRVPAGGSASTLLLPPVHTEFDAYLDQAPIGSDHTPLAAVRAFHLLELPASAEGGWLRLRISSTYIKTGLRGEILTGTQHSLIRGMLQRDLARVVLVLLFLLVGTAAWVAALRGLDPRAFAGYGLWLCSTALWTAFYTQIRDLLLPNPELWLALWAVGLLGVGIGFMWFFQATFAPTSRLIRVLTRINVAVAVLGLALLVIRPPSGVANAFLIALRSLFIFEWLVIAGFVIHLLRDGNLNARVYAAGMLVLGCFGVRDLLLSLGAIDAGDPLAHWGSLGVFVASGFVLQRRLAAVRDERDAYADELAATARERAMLLRDLHDGLGRITTTISMLSGSKASPGALSTIQALADEGNREIRTFMHALDDGESDWSSLEAQIRLTTRRAAEAVEGEASISFDVGAAPAPSAYLYVHVLRVLQEALTNAIKYSQRPNLQVTLQADANQLLLSVVNDGVSSDEARHAGVNQGAGMKNMRERASELGGALNFDLDTASARARLELRIPLPVRYAGLGDGVWGE